MIKAWTAQHASVLSELDTQGIYSCRRSPDFEEFTEAYRFMKEAMGRRLNAFYHDRWPVWVWPEVGGFTGKQLDINDEGLLEKGTPGVILELHIPEDKIVLSDSDLWHSPLNSQVIGEDGAIGMKASWEKIFDIHWSNQDWTLPACDKTIQGTLWYLKRQWVVNTHHFVAK